MRRSPLKDIIYWLWHLLTCSGIFYPQTYIRNKSFPQTAIMWLTPLNRQMFGEEWFTITTCTSSSSSSYSWIAWSMTHSIRTTLDLTLSFLAPSTHLMMWRVPVLRRVPTFSSVFLPPHTAPTPYLCFLLCTTASSKGSLKPEVQGRPRKAHSVSHEACSCSLPCFHLN